jgi:hypothetical protein
MVACIAVKEVKDLIFITYCIFYDDQVLIDFTKWLSALYGWKSV